MHEEALKVTEKRREAKGKGEKERYPHLNAKFQRRARRVKKAFLSDQCKVIDESNRMGKTRDLFKKITDTRGTFHAKMGTIKDRNRMLLLLPTHFSRVRLSDPIDSSPSGSPVLGILQARTQKRTIQKRC